ncbi:MAG: hybrid sensor histidine kinase/response regulator [Acidimicrobiales bacterium]
MAKKKAHKEPEKSERPSAGAARDAVRRSQHLASQLHQLLAASNTVSTLRDESAIVVAVAESARDVFSAERAVVAWDADPGVRGVAEHGADAFAEPATGKADYPVATPERTEPWTDGRWLCAPLALERGRARGVVAVRRTSGADDADADAEVLTLLAQTAATALATAELARGVANSEARLRVLVESAPVGLVEVDPDGGVRWWNLPASRILAWPEYREAATAPRFPASALDELRELWREVADGASTSGRELDEVPIGNRRRQLTVTAAALPTTGSEPAGVLTLIDDVTDSRQLRAEVRHAHAMETRGQIASRLAHDFNNLLTLVSGYAEILSHDLRDDDRSLKMVKDIQATASRASLLTSQLQTIGRTKAPTPVVFDPITVIASNAEVLERILGSHIELDWALTGDAGTVRVDADQFEQMVLNLAINARDAMPSGGRLTVAVERDELGDVAAGALGVAAGTFVRVRVADTGVGMDEETRRRCFEPFFTTKGPFKGTGMGLAAAQRLVTESGGAIDVRSSPGDGTAFDVYLPFAGESAAAPAAPVTAEAPRGSASVLVVDDDDALRHLMAQVLTRNGYRVVEAASGEDALGAFDASESPIDLVVSDVVMGELNGRDLAGALRERDPALKVLLASGTADESIVEGLGVGHAAFLAKPFKPSALIDAVHALLARG